MPKISITSLLMKFFIYSYMSTYIYATYPFESKLLINSPSKSST